MGFASEDTRGISFFLACLVVLTKVSFSLNSSKPLAASLIIMRCWEVQLGDPMPRYKNASSVLLEVEVVVTPCFCADSGVLSDLVQHPTARVWKREWWRKDPSLPVLMAPLRDGKRKESQGSWRRGMGW